MDSAGLRALQAPIKDRYKADPKAGLITLKAKGALDDTNIACKVETGRALAVAGLHPATGGSGMELCSGEACRLSSVIRHLSSVICPPTTTTSPRRLPPSVRPRRCPARG